MNVTSFVGDILKGTRFEKPIDVLYYSVFGPRTVHTEIAGVTLQFNARSSHEFLSAPTLEDEKYIVERTIEEMGDGDVVWDIGANVGWHACAFGSKGSVYAFEPNPLSLRRLNEAVALNPESNVVPIGVGVGDKTDSMNLVSRLGSGAGASPDNENGLMDREFTVGVFDPDDLMSMGIPQPDVIKIDIEGAEYDVLSSFDNLNSRLVLIEFHSWVNKDELHGFMEDEGYSVLDQQERGTETLKLYTNDA